MREGGVMNVIEYSGALACFGTKSYGLARDSAFAYRSTCRLDGLPASANGASAEERTAAKSGMRATIIGWFVVMRPTRTHSVVMHVTPSRAAAVGRR
jgi:hypothetical protein